MYLKVRRVDNYNCGIKVFCGDTIVDLGMQSKRDLDELGEELVNALCAIAPAGEQECAQWIRGLLDKAGVKGG